ncbi:multidrug ABC transporter ATPase [uncultured Microbacterium sp.]|uniref:multidrug ABC transporter ATPase n=1 Tax=uncultured Microbacterium sp. TaxID=191216 RepID=UPI00345AE3E8
MSAKRNKARGTRRPAPVNDPVPAATTASRLDRILAFMSLGIAAASIICFFAIMIGTAVGMKQADYATGLWPVVAMFPLIGLPIAFLLILALLITTFVRRSRAARDADPRSRTSAR